jgi:hypothetical protein
MTSPTPIAFLSSQFDDFLFAPIGESNNGMPLSVVSALARLDLDPWQEAATLTGMPKETATQRLISMIAAVPGEPPTQRDPGIIAARLIALLPHAPHPVAPLASSSVGGKLTANRRITIFVFFVVFMLVIQFMTASYRLPAHTDGGDAPTASTESTQVSPPIPTR